ncbi:(2Fe-2S)-binding protein [Neobacillus sp. NPDC097160]|uniref:(2Fe-2S)-binding protein n=1 Tax=Neobacillus sp. NPDC097160 TaxID=3364298 RepID=UPI0038086F19
MTLEKIELTVNGKKVIKDVESRLLLADFLREELRLTGTHLGCEHGVCGACTVKMDNRPVRSCLVLAVQADGAEIETVESLAADNGTLHPLQQAFSDNHALQCGFCTPGFLMSLVCDLEKNPSPDESEIREMISGNLCRCTGYTNIIKAVKQYTTENVSNQRVDKKEQVAVKS